MRTIEYKINEPLQARDVSEVFRGSGIKRPADDLVRIQRMIDNADINVSAWDGTRLIGVARAITDYAYCCYLSDLAVRGEYQKAGIGKELVRIVREQIGEEVSLLLLSAPSAMDYYPRIGFEKKDNAFIVPRTR
ncbi:GNAT family N-acetyltransferase [Cohnella cholangitidis]|uniref:GNAT family N-acetyltransferase n=1 Tax=Cohnella cholangitidis TaxID=2598458 RepID=UPI001E530624|nr:GNAT family N-acetyltransferase [Cohnella cholangitidis]